MSMAAKKAGRPSEYTEELGDEICSRISAGESLNDICKSGAAQYGTVCRWLQAQPTFREKYVRAREDQAEFYANQIVSIADEVELETKYDGDDVRLELSAASVARNKLRVEARKWVAAKLLPKRYGERNTTEITGPDGGPVNMSLQVSFIGVKGSGG